MRYLAAPYTNFSDRSDLALPESRYQEACKAAAKLMQSGDVVFSPLSHSHHIADYLARDLRASHSFWMNQDLAILKHCSRLTVLMLDGWEGSKGVAEEIAFARRHGIPTNYLRPYD